MICFLTSSFWNGYVRNIDDDLTLNDRNDFVKRLRAFWPLKAKLLIIASNPDDINNEKYGLMYAKTFSNTFGDLKYSLIDHNNKHFDMKDYNVIVLCGGHVPTQNDFLTELQFETKLQDFNGVLIGLSAGTMNCEKIVYAPEEEKNDFISKEYKRYLKGLGIIDKMIIPHYVYGDEKRDSLVFGKRMYKDIYIPDSYNHELLFIEDGTYIICESNKTELFGKAYTLNKGIFKKICDDDERIIF